MDIALLTLYDEYYAAIGEISSRNKHKYATKHGYSFLCECIPFDMTKPTPWKKIEAIRRYLPNYDYVFWTDADSLIMNDTIRLENFIEDNWDLIVTRDYNNLNTGNFFIRNSNWSLKFLEKVDAQEQFIQHPWWEQAAIIYLIDIDNENEKHINYISQRTINSYIENYQEGDFIIHFAGYGRRNKLKLLQLMRKWSKRVS